MQLNDLVHQESISTVSEDPSAAPRNRFTPSALRQGAMAFLKRSLARNQRRRSVYRARQLRVRIDGEERWQFDPSVRTYGTFSVPLRASYLEVFGDDDDGDLLLAVLPLPEPVVFESERTLHLFVTLEGGQTVAMEIALGDQTGGEVSEYCVQIAYVESAEVDTRGAEHHAGRATLLLPRPETSTLWTLWIPLGPTIIGLLVA
jgi:hypothetical protein